MQPLSRGWYNPTVRGRIAIIEDEKDIVELVRYNFRKEGFDVHAFGRGKDGLEYVRRNSIDLLLLDVLLPDLDGFEICRQIRSISLSRARRTGES